jgi:glycosyltransferase involved in cell wall biosynthesis
MISIIVSIKNRAHLLKWSLKAIAEQTYVKRGGEVEVNVIDGISTDNLDEVLAEASNYFTVVNKYVFDKKKSVYRLLFNCPAESYNIGVKLSTGEVIYKTDPEMVILDKEFIDKSLEILKSKPNAFIMPFPYHVRDFEFNSLKDIEDKYLEHYQPTHINKNNAVYEMVYYQAIFSRKSYIDAGGVDERFIENGIGSEDNHHHDQWKRRYGIDSFIPLIDSPAVHMYHGEWGLGGVPQELYRYVNTNAALRKQLSNVYPNEGREWGRLYSHITKTTWVGGNLISKVPRPKTFNLRRG